ncbi:hypothetical protein [Deinococcus humi]|uniref:Uncharacterized protein n=1 Tax=Deinococcus humi TaxID=662880 RepID=A0A7W8JS36_9DEIO|nr:hypothetical protein [Deinococcus humi]MBB5362104.1 hypothetical protein [Deinococcus humi]GGO22054.1 hypothetical protein GCM10008949_08930 [Deinococcus humi]
MKQTLKVAVDAIKHEYNLKGTPMTVLHLELPSGADLKFLQRAHRISHKDDGWVSATFTLRIYGGGDRRTWRLESRGSKTKDFKVVAVVELYFSPGSRFEQYFSPVDPDRFDIELDVEVEEAQDNTPLFPKTQKDEDEGLNA